MDFNWINPKLATADYILGNRSSNAGFRGALQLVYVKGISTGEQANFDYAMCMTGNFGSMKCACGIRECRQFSTGDDWTIPMLQQKYAFYWQPYIQEKILAQRLVHRETRG